MVDWLGQTVLAIIIVVVTARSYLLKKVKELLRYKELLEQIPGPKPGWIFGSVNEYNFPREHISAVYDKWFKEYGSISRVWKLTYLEVDVFVCKAEFLEIILTSTKHIKKSNLYNRINSWLGTGLLTSTGSKWHLHRKLITPAFHFRILEDFLQVFVEKSQTLVNKLHKISGDAVVDLMPVISRCTLDIICETAMGTQINMQEDEEYDDYVKTTHEVNELVIYREFRPWLYPDFIYFRTAPGKRYLKCLQILHGFTEKVIQERKLQKKSNSQSSRDNKTQDAPPGYKKRLALLDLLLDTCDSEHPLTDLEIREEVDTFMFEGHDTTAMAITWTFYLLGRHPHIQDAVAEELESIFTGTDRSCTQEDLADMKYLERVIKESLRLYPSVPFIGRHIEEELKLGEYTIPANTNVSITIYHLHRDPKLYPNPDTFNPDNFLPERIRDRHPYAYLPFSAGSRNCIGQKFAMMELKMVISSVIRKFTIESMEENPLTLKELTLKPVNGLLVKLKPRKC